MPRAILAAPQRQLRSIYISKAKVMLMLAVCRSGWARPTRYRTIPASTINPRTVPMQMRAIFTAAEEQVLNRETTLK